MNMADSSCTLQVCIKIPLVRIQNGHVYKRLYLFHPDCSDLALVHVSIPSPTLPAFSTPVPSYTVCPPLVLGHVSVHLAHQVRPQRRLQHHWHGHRAGLLRGVPESGWTGGSLCADSVHSTCVTLGSFWCGSKSWSCWGRSRGNTKDQSGKKTRNH